MKKTYGSGHFGEWVEDEYGLPAYRYDCDQTKDEKAIYASNTMWKKRNDHFYQFGNDKIVAIASNYGYVQLRQDEGSPKFLNDFDPEHNQYAGGIGYLQYQDKLLSTYYAGDKDKFIRIFGAGYLKKQVANKEFDVEQIIYAPHGDSETLVSQITITNKTEAEQEVCWTEYWGNQMYQFSNRPIQMVGSKKTPEGEAIAYRREFDKNFEKKYYQAENEYGLVCARQFTGWNYPIGGDGITGITEMNVAYPPTLDKASFEDLTPPSSFILALDCKPWSCEADADRFFGAGGVINPEGLHRALEPDVMAEDIKNGALILKTKLKLKPKESKKLRFLYGYVLNQVDAIKNLEEFKGRDFDFIETVGKWKKNNVILDIPEEPWIKREMLWHNQYLKGGLTYDAYFKEYILSQGNVYQYVFGFQGAARDPLQHVLPFVYSRPELVRAAIRYTLKETLPDGEIPIGITGNGMRFPGPFHPSDQELWVLWLLGEYVLASKETAFISEKIRGEETVLDIARNCYQHLVSSTGFGQHGLLRMLKGDWSDHVILDNVTEDKIEAASKESESVFNAAFAIHALEVFAEGMEYAGEQAQAEEAKKTAESQRTALRSIWNGKWFQRAWITAERGWIGEDEMWLEAQPWAMIGKVLKEEEQQILINNLNQNLRNPSPIGTMKRDKKDGLVWWALNGPLVEALSMVDADLAWEEWTKNSLARHAEVYPDIWFGIWSGPDCYTSVLAKYPGQTRFKESLMEKMRECGTEIDDSKELMELSFIDFPVSCMHAHAWPLYSASKLIGLEFNKEGLAFNTSFNKKVYSFESPLVGFQRTQQGYFGCYTPEQLGDWTVKIKIRPEEVSLLGKLIVNGEETSFEITEGNMLLLKGYGGPGKALTWSVLFTKKND